VASRVSGGVRGITLGRDNDCVVSMNVAQDDLELLVVTEKGMGKRTPMKDYRVQTRGGKGIITMAVNPKGGEIVSANVVSSDDKAIILTSNGIAIRLRLSEVRCCGRSTMGVKMINLEEGDSVASVAIVPTATATEEEEASE
jgi:DNA gyrase subunit A